MQWGEFAYEFFGGPKHPHLALTLMVILGAVLGFGFWKFSGWQYAKTHPTASSPSITPPASGNANTVGDQSPAISGSGNQVNYGSSSQPKGQKPRPQKH